MVEVLFLMVVNKKGFGGVGGLQVDILSHSVALRELSENTAKKKKKKEPQKKPKSLLVVYAGLGSDASDEECGVGCWCWRYQRL